MTTDHDNLKGRSELSDYIQATAQGLRGEITESFWSQGDFRILGV